MNVIKELGRYSRLRSPLFGVISSRGSKSIELGVPSSGNSGTAAATTTTMTTFQARKEAVGECAGSSRPLRNSIKSRPSRLDGISGEGLMQQHRETKCYRDNVRQREISWRNFESNGFYEMMKGSAIPSNYVVPSILIRNTRLCPEKEKDLLHGTWWNGELEQITRSLNYIYQFGQKGLIESEKDLVRGICIRLDSAPDEKSRSIPFLSALTYLDSIILNNFELYPRFSRALNTYCQALLPHLCTNEIFRVFHCYRLIGDPAINWQGSFPERALTTLGQQMHTFKSSQLVQLCYFIGICRKAVGDMTKLQQHIEKHIGNMKVGELALVISAFFKTNVPIVDNLILSTIVYKAKQARKTIEPLYFTAILKSLRFHQGALKQPAMLMLFLEFISLDTLSPEGFSHLLHYASAHLIYQEVLMREIRNRVARDIIKSARLKDVEKLLMYASRIGYSSEHADAICNTVMDHLKSTCRTSRAREIQRYPFTFINCIAYLSSINKYDAELLDLAFDKRFLSRLQFEKNSWWEMLFLDRNVLIDFPEYQQDRVTQHHHKQLVKITVGDRIASAQYPRIHHFEQIISSVAFTLKNMFNCTFCVLVGRVLPQYIQSNIIIRLDKATGRGVPIPSDFLPETLIQPRFPSGTDDTNWLAFELVAETRVILGTFQPYGLHQSKLRHLRSLGYIPYIIMEPDWSKHVTEAERFSYLGKLISGGNEGTIKPSGV